MGPFGELELKIVLDPFARLGQWRWAKEEKNWEKTLESFDKIPKDALLFLSLIFYGYIFFNQF